MNHDDFFGTDQIKPIEGEAEIIDLTAEPYQDLSRVRILFRLSYFRDPPNGSIVLSDGAGEELASVEIINISQPDNEITLHIPNHPAPQGEYQVELTLFHLHEREARGNEEGEIKLTSKKISSKRTAFTLP
jgi:hypothetical protein